jgi:hypothetical protein
VVLSGWPQKIVFMCNSNDDIIERIRKHVKACFNSDIEVLRSANETVVTVQHKVYRSIDECNVELTKLIRHITKFGGKEETQAVGIRPLIEMTAGENSYRYKPLGDNFYIDEIKHMIGHLMSFGGNNITINVMSGCIINGDINNNNNLPNGDITLRWIRQNPPAYNELKNVYYERYLNTFKEGVAENSFGKQMKTAGYETRRSGNNRYWKKI